MTIKPAKTSTSNGQPERSVPRASPGLSRGSQGLGARPIEMIVPGGVGVQETLYEFRAMEFVFQSVLFRLFSESVPYFWAPVSTRLLV